MTATEEQQQQQQQPVPPAQPSLPWRMASAAIMTITSGICRAFLFGLNDVKIEGQEQFLEVLDKRREGTPERGLITVSNHISVLFKTFFGFGQVLPTYRTLYSPYAGPFQPTVTEAIRILSGPGAVYPLNRVFNAGRNETFSSPAYYRTNHNAWVHVFPEGCVHQHPERTLRYFKWGVSRLILESEPAPQIVPIFIDGFSDIMPEDRKWPRWAPRIGAKIRVIYGEALEVSEAFREQRLRWKRMVQKETEALGRPLIAGEVPETLKDHPEAVQLRIEVAKTVRDMVQKLRLRAGYPQDAPSLELAETWEREPKKKQFKSPVDDSLVHKE
ncbi:Lysophosphatidylcholine acyltransferase [Colletotrichum chlorophyti]|uniref:Tafazzin family protein n=1 Tax=Colletotrichum chlorophyti TaxID=708187 RepID=A0A1Q8RB31_9PEZI|nr:Lysophosphatidylcholine acyltransferase [Colletotrichum chlorophyti]